MRLEQGIRRKISRGCVLAAISQTAVAGSCQDLHKARDATYFTYGQALSKDEVMASNEAREELAQTFARKARFGDPNSLRKLIALGLITAAASKQPPLEVTFKLVCEAAKAELPPPNVLDPLTCSVAALDGSRRDHASNRLLARQMLDLAKTNLASDKNGPVANRLFDATAEIIQRCAQE